MHHATCHEASLFSVNTLTVHSLNFFDIVLFILVSTVERAAFTRFVRPSGVYVK